MHARNKPLSEQLKQELLEDMADELSGIDGLLRIHVVSDGEERLGAELGSVFVEFKDAKGATEAREKLNGRKYDGRKITVRFVEETIYYSDLYFK